MSFSILKNILTRCGCFHAVFSGVWFLTRNNNGEAERAAQRAKQILKPTDPFLALMIHRATPLQTTGCSGSPTRLMLGTQIRTPFPTLQTKLEPAWPDLQHVGQVDERAKQSYSYNNRYDVRPLPELQPGTSVAVKLDNEHPDALCGLQSSL